MPLDTNNIKGEHCILKGSYGIFDILAKVLLQSLVLQKSSCPSIFYKRNWNTIFLPLHCIVDINNNLFFDVIVTYFQELSAADAFKLATI